MTTWACCVHGLGYLQISKMPPIMVLVELPKIDIDLKCPFCRCQVVQLSDFGDGDGAMKVVAIFEFKWPR